MMSWAYDLQILFYRNGHNINFSCFDEVDSNYVVFMVFARIMFHNTVHVRTGRVLLLY